MKIACLCQSIEINNKHVHRQPAVGSSGLNARWSLGRAVEFKFFSLILDSSVGSSADIQSVEDLVPETLWVGILHSAEEDKLSPFD